MALYVPAKYIVKKYTGPKLSEHSATSQRILQRAHWVDPVTGAWVAKPPTPVRAAAAVVRAPASAPVVRPKPKPKVKPKPKPKPRVSGGSVGSGTTAPPPPDPGYQGLSDAEIEARAHALAASQLGDKSAAIERARAAAMAQAQRDAATYQALGQAQMGMISQIPAQLQGIRDTAGSAIASYGNQLSQGSAAGLQAQQAAAASFEAGQTGMAPTAPGVVPAGTAAPDGSAPAPDAGGAPAATGPGPGAPQALGVNAQATMAASAQMGGVIPATQQAEIGAASANAAAGMPAVVARATQDQVAMRMAQAATEDADYRQQLIDLAATQGGAYEDALSSLYDIESKKFGSYEAQQRLKMDQQQFEYKKMTDQRDYDLQVQAELASEVAAGTKSKLQAQKDWRSYKLAQQRNAISQQNADTSATRAGLSAADYYTDAKGRTVPKGYKYNAQGTLVKVATTGKKPISSTPGGGRGIALANKLAAQYRGTPTRSAKDPKTGLPGTTSNPPRVDYGKAFIQIRDQLIGMGYKRAEAEAIAHNALNAHYGDQYRPGKQRGR